MEMDESRIAEFDYCGYYIVVTKIKPWSAGNYEAKGFKRIPGVRPDPYTLEPPSTHLFYGAKEEEAVRRCKDEINMLLTEIAKDFIDYIAKQPELQKTSLDIIDPNEFVELGKSQGYKFTT